MSSLIGIGVGQLFRGARRGQAMVAGFGAALTLVGFLRRRAKAQRRLLYARTLKDGESLTVRLRRGAVSAGDDSRAG
jgi:hypothetical protein